MLHRLDLLNRQLDVFKELLVTFAGDDVEALLVSLLAGIQECNFGTEDFTLLSHESVLRAVDDNGLVSTLAKLTLFFLGFLRLVLGLTLEHLSHLITNLSLQSLGVKLGTVLVELFAPLSHVLTKSKHLLGE